MPWSKGAVVIIKRGDEEWADSMENALVPKKDICDDEEMKTLKRDNELTKIHDTRFTNNMIEALLHTYGPIPKPIPKWLDWLLAPWTLLIYGVSLFTNKYLIIK